MLPFIAALLSGAAVTAGATDAQVGNLPGVFEATCLDGQAKLSAGEVTPSSFDQLPSSLRESLGRPASGNVWRLNTSGNSYLYVLNYPGGPGMSPKVCGLASDAMDLRTASDALGTRVAGGVERSSSGRSAQWLNARDGYIATATTAAELKVLQISWMSDEDKARALEQIEQLPH
jgi:hypothetical protein